MWTKGLWDFERWLMYMPWESGPVYYIVEAPSVRVRARGTSYFSSVVPLFRSLASATADPHSLVGGHVTGSSLLLSFSQVTLLSSTMWNVWTGP